MIPRLLCMLVLVSLTTGCSQPLPVEQPQPTATAQPTAQNATSFFNQGMAHMPQSDAIDLAELDKAIANFDQAIQIRPDFAEAYYYRAEAYYSRGMGTSSEDDQERAFADYDKAIQLRPRYREAYRARGWAYESKGDSDKAFADFDKLIELFPGLAEAYLNRASLCYDKWAHEWEMVYRMMRDYDRALADCNEENKLTPEITETRRSRADLCSDKCGYASVRADLDKAIELDRDYAEAYFFRGMLLRDLGSKTEAIADLSKYLESPCFEWSVFCQTSLAQEWLSELGAP